MGKFVIFTVSVILFCTSLLNAQTLSKSDLNLPKLYNDNDDGFVVIAHRGASAYYPENTMAAFRGAVEMNAEMIELDIMLSKDGVPVAFHDAKLNVHSNGKGKLADYTLEELKKLDAGSWFDKKFAGEEIPTLEEVLAYAAGKVALNIEIKTEAVTNDLYGGVEEKSIELVKKYGMEEHVMFSSFDFRAVSHLKELAPAISTALLYEKRQSGKKRPSDLVKQYRADAFNCSYRQLNKKRMNDLSVHKIPVFVYTVDQEARMRKLLDMGVSGIFTNKPDVLWGVLETSEKE